MVDLSIIIPTKDRGEIFNQTYYALINAISGINAEIIIVNDSKVPLNIKTSKETLILQNYKGGVAAGRNLGALKASGKKLLFLDDDMLLDSKILKRLLQVNVRESEIVMPNWSYSYDSLAKISKSSFGRFLIRYNWVSLKGWSNSEEWNDHAIFKTSGGASYCLLISKAKFEEIGGYNESFPFAGFEDFDFIQRAKGAGISFYIDPIATIIHNEIDRTSLGSFLDRRERNAFTQKVAVNLGYQNLKISYEFVKRILIYFFDKCYPLIYFGARNFPNIKGLDFAYFFLVKILIVVKIFRGYNHDR
ncbi:MAG: glycosyltransferase family 2 protein [Cytophagaceae bacterium]